MAITGHATDEMVTHYSRQIDQGKMAARDLLGLENDRCLVAGHRHIVVAGGNEEDPQQDGDLVPTASVTFPRALIGDALAEAIKQIFEDGSVTSIFDGVHL